MLQRCMESLVSKHSIAFSLFFLNLSMLLYFIVVLSCLTFYIQYFMYIFSNQNGKHLKQHLFAMKGAI